MAKKPSFFEKLTGANWSEKESLEEKPEKKPVIKTKKNKTTKDMATEKDAFIKEETPVEKKGKISPPKKESEDWLAESEGQLTIDVYQTPNEIVIKSTIAGVSPDDIDISITNDMITIKGRRQKDEEVKEEDYYYQECYWGPFSRSVILPVDVEVDRADASMKNGILIIRLPKVEKVKTKKITIKAE